jgi:iron complex outermembrane receptor protein
MSNNQRPGAQQLTFGRLGWTGLLIGAAAFSSAKVHAQESVSSASEGTALQEVVVSARKREEPLQDVPIAVTALDANALAQNHVDNVEDLTSIAPDLMISKSQGSANSAAVFIRGIGQDNSTILSENGVGIYIDGVYLARQIGSLVDLVDVDQVEVLRGPQGTLYGRNNLGGAIKIDTLRPQTDELTYRGDVTIGSFSRLDLRASVNAPISDQMAMTLSGSSRTDDGYYTNAANGGQLNRKDTQTGRLGFLYNITPDLDLYVTADISKDHSGANTGTPFTSADPLNTRPIYGNFESDPALPDTNRFSSWGTSITVDWNVGVGKVTSITAMRHMNFVQADNLSGVPWDAPADFTATNLNLNRHEEEHQLSEELQFVSNWSFPVSMTSGLYYFREFGDEYLGFDLSPTLELPFIAQQTSTSEAAYTEFNYALTSQLGLTAGARYTHDDKGIVRGGPLAGISAGNNNNEFTPRAMISYKPAKDYLLYASWARGYQEGEYQPFPGSNAQAAAITAPQKVTAYEVGAKTEWLQHRLRANLALFRNTYSDLATGVVSSGGDGSLVTETAADLRSQGGELELTAKVMEGLTLNASYSYDDTKYLSVSGPYSVSNPQVGQSTKYTPKNTERVGANYEFPVSAIAHAEFGTNLSYRSQYLTEVPSQPWYIQGAYALLDARAAYVDDRHGWSVTLGGQNLTNKLYFIQSTLLSGPMRFFQPQRTWSLQFAFHPGKALR